MYCPIIYSVFASRPVPSSTSLLPEEDSAVHTVALWWSKRSVKILNSVYPIVSAVQSLSRVRLFMTPWIAARQASLSITNSWSSLTHVHRVSDAILPSHPLSSPSPPAPNPIVGTCKWTDSDKRPPAPNSITLALQESTCEQEKHWKSFIKLTLVYGLKVIR